MEEGFAIEHEEFRTSTEIGKLVEALSKAQVDFQPIKKSLTAKVKTKSGAEFEYKYADLDAVIDATRPHLSKNGLVIMQFPLSNVQARTLTMVTRLAHLSGEWVEGRISLPSTMRDAFDAQSIGSAMTYGRRYGWSAITGVASEIDDDGKSSIQDGGSHEAQADVAQQRLEEMRAKLTATLPPALRAKLTQAKPATEPVQIATAQPLVLTGKLPPDKEFTAPPAIPMTRGARVAAVSTDEVYGLLKIAKKLQRKPPATGEYMALTVIDPNDKMVKMSCFDNRKYADGSTLFGLLQTVADAGGGAARFSVKRTGQYINVVSPIQIDVISFDEDGMPMVDRGVAAGE